MKLFKIRDPDKGADPSKCQLVCSYPYCMWFDEFVYIGKFLVN